MSELAFIAALRGLAIHPGARNLDDDCAVIEFGGETLVLTHDMMAEGVHFLPGQDPADVAWKLVATNMSDLAAKGAEPVGVLVGYMLGRDDARFLAGLAEALAHFGAPLLGGDTISGGGAQTLGLTAIGRATYRPVPSRGGANAGDTLYITGPVGGAMMGFEALRSGSGGNAAYLRPEALLLDASRIARASGVTLAIEASAVPIAAPEPRRGDALRWGDDYQLLFTAPAGFVPPVEAHAIGQVLAQLPSPILLDGVALSEADGLGYQHGKHTPHNA
jgi:thiamine-monophosphate kinase